LAACNPSAKFPWATASKFSAKLSDLELSLRSRELGMALRAGRYLIWLAEVLAG